MRILNNLEPKEVYKYFEDICGIPHGSRNTKQISDYVENFAKEHEFKYHRDDMGNLIIYKDANPNTPDNNNTVILQGHMDMVCEKEDGYDFDFENEGLNLKIEDGYVTAEHTTLGADDGIGVAYMMAILADDSLVHPPLECVFTVDEEIGMFGAEALDKSRLSGKILLNIDSEVEGELLVSCAGGATPKVTFPITRRGAQGERCVITLSGFKGGHSGVDIMKGRASSNAVMAALLKELFYIDDSMRVVSVDGGFKDNAYSMKTTAVVITKRTDELSDGIKDVFDGLISEYKETDPNIRYDFVKAQPDSDIYNSLTDIQKGYPLDEMVNLSFIMAFSSLPSGIQTMSKDIENMAQTSLNPGILVTTEDEISVSYCARSSSDEEKMELMEELRLIASSAGGSLEVTGVYPGWKYDPDAKLKDLMNDTYKEMFGEDMMIHAIHAGVECGFFVEGIPGLEAVSFGPELLDIHTFNERMNIESAEKIWKYILRVLEKLA